MKRKYNTLNEEMNRMKSLFGESRLYGNIVDREEEIITEQFKFFDDLASAFKLALKNVDTRNLNRFINYVANDIGDVVRYLDDADFKTILKTLVPTQNWDEVAKTVKNIQRNFDKIPEATDAEYKKFFKEVIAGIPEEGGMRNNIIQMMNNKRYGSSSNLPAVSGTKEVVRTTSGEVAIGTKNADGGIVYKNQKGDIIPSEQIKKIDDDITVVGKLGIDKDGRRVFMDDDSNVKAIEGEDGVWRDLDGKEPKFDSNTIDVDYIEVKPGTPLDDLNSKTVAPTNKNAEEVLQGSKKVAEGAEENVVTFTITGKGKDGIKSAEEMVDSFTNRGGGNGSVDEVVDDVIDKTVDIPPKDIPGYRKFLKNWFTKWPSKFWFNPLAIGEGRMKGFSDFSVDPKTGKQKYSAADKVGQVGLYSGVVSLRTLVINPVTLFALWTGTRSYQKDRSLLTGIIEDFAVLVKTFWDFWEDVKVSNDVLDGLKRSVVVISEKQIDPDVVVDNMNKAALNAITGATNGSSFIECDEIIGKTNEDIYKLAFSKIKGEEKARVGRILQTGGLDPEKVNEVKAKVDGLIDFVVQHNGVNDNLDKIIEKTREKCLLEKTTDEENQKIIEGDYVVDLKGGVR